jgi:LPXTG-site transpeptidase (sortase) family protein
VWRDRLEATHRLMTVDLRNAGHKRLRPARRGPRPATLLLAAGVVAFISGIAIVGTGLAPMFGFGGETATVAQPALVQSVADPNPGSAGGVSAGFNAVTAPAIVDVPVNGISFQIRIPALHYSAAVREGVDAKTLTRGPGHYPTTAWPGREGTVGVAAHNVYWLSFNRLQVGDRVELQTRHGLFAYEITGSKITVATDVAVLHSTTEHRLALTTCYPLWAGAFATKRLVFFARQIGGAA